MHGDAWYRKMVKQLLMGSSMSTFASLRFPRVAICAWANRRRMSVCGRLCS
ncbi:hypothetical protein BBAG_0202 [Bifidobacterium angulatum DSM 20098 = JCM 7096]|nr:hypothetical protein BBAG_0202 [Bifidobacterium angulatum DSM 20098 = JCM 7096]